MRPLPPVRVRGTARTAASAKEEVWLPRHDLVRVRVRVRARDRARVRVRVRVRVVRVRVGAAAQVALWALRAGLPPLLYAGALSTSRASGWLPADSCEGAQQAG